MLNDAPPPAEKYQLPCEKEEPESDTLPLLLYFLRCRNILGVTLGEGTDKDINILNEYIFTNTEIYYTLSVAPKLCAMVPQGPAVNSEGCCGMSLVASSSSFPRQCHLRLCRIWSDFHKNRAQPKIATPGDENRVPMTPISLGLTVLIYIL